MKETAPAPLLEACSVTIAYGDAPARSVRNRVPAAIADVTLKVCTGDIVCLVGPSGCGKTSLLKALGGFLPPRSGKVLFKGEELHASTREIVMIFQEHNLYPWLTVAGNIMFAPRMLKKSRREQKQIAEHLLEVVGLQDAAHKYPDQLSGGMRQHVAIARALAAKAQVLLLDEPFNALDVSLRRRMQTFIREIWRDAHTTMIMVTHDIEEAILVGQQVVVLGGRPGNIVQTVDTSNPALEDRYSEAFRTLCRRLEGLVGDTEPGSSALPESSLARADTHSLLTPPASVRAPNLPPGSAVSISQKG